MAYSKLMFISIPDLGKGRRITEKRTKTCGLPDSKGNWLNGKTQERGYLRDTCLTAQDQYKRYLDYFRISYE